MRKKRRETGTRDTSIYEPRKKKKRIRGRKIVMSACWLLFLSAFAWSVYKNFTAIDRITVREEKVIEPEVADTSGVASFVKNFCIAYYECPTDAGLKAQREELLKEYMADGLYELSAVSHAEKDIHVADVQIWGISLNEKGNYEVSYTVAQKSGENATVSSAYTVEAYAENNKYAILQLPYLVSRPDKADEKADIMGQDKQAGAALREEVGDFLHTFFAVYPSADPKELKYYFKGEPGAIGRELELASIDNITVEEQEDGAVKVGCFVTYSDPGTGLDETGQYELEVQKQDDGKYVILNIR